MSKRRILIVDDEESVLGILESSLKKQHQDSEIVTAMDGRQALERLRETAFDLVVTDYKMAGMDGLELLGAIREMRPETQVILITAYGNDEIEQEARRLQAFKLLAKPLRLNTLNRVVDEALEEIAISRPGILILSDERYLQAVELLQDLLANITARCIFLVTSEGHVVLHAGIASQLPVEQISSLLGGGMAALLAAGRLIDGDADSMNMAYREGKDEGLYAINIGEQLMLLLITDRGPYSSPIGSVWFYAQRAVADLRRTLGQTEVTNPNQVFQEDVGEEFDRELEQLLDPEATETLDRKSENPPQASDNQDTDAAISKVMSYSDAVAAGHITEQVSNQGEEDLTSKSGERSEKHIKGKSAK